MKEHRGRARADAGPVESVAPAPDGGAEVVDALRAGAERCPLKWWHRIGVVGFLFFFIKGLLWLIVPSLLVWWRTRGG